MLRTKIVAFCTPFVITLASLVAAADPTPQEEIDLLVPQAMKILEKWEQEEPVAGNRKLHVVYWTPNDREPAPLYRERLSAILLDIQNFYATEMKRLGFGERTIQFDLKEDGLVNIHVVTGEGPYAQYDTPDGRRIRQECVPPLREAGINPDEETIVIFCNMSNWNPEERTIRQNSPYYASGTPTGGNAWQVDSPILDLQSLSNKGDNVRDGQYGNISIGKYNSIFIGGVCHELGHALGLPHCQQRPDEQQMFGTALMGSGNRSYGDNLRGEGRGTFLTLANGLKLASHPQFSGSIKGLSAKSDAKVDIVKVEEVDGAVQLTGRVTANPPPYAVLGYLDPDGHSNYDAFTAVAVPNEAGEFTLRYRPLKPNFHGRIRIDVCQVNGAASTYAGDSSRWGFDLTTDGKGKPQLHTIQQKLELTLLIEAVKSRDKKQIAEICEKLQGSGDSLVAEVAKRLAAPREAKRPHISPLYVPKEVTEVPLSDCQPETAHVGYGPPAYDHAPNDQLLLEARGRIFRHGIWAHAPAQHTYDLGGAWQNFSGTVGIAGTRGSVVFVINADGKELYRSPKIEPGRLHDFWVEVVDVARLELVVEDGGDGKDNDWAMWLEPVLGR
ncbi:NPCBM/NEW2 domain-containing protein [Blastopirellula sp. JC732]|uniref:NPCBM/NEW2 domain-containing protein n=1 Tax=Blastopirellula sediminis TaxID=2894196 RepID=A0A9X1MLX3_9BACT|nr:NPCBM/NEW2 domain-containing protein [Blastopirellula sediminis]MCC9607229.1 NPCBM/NEW2 domain-containing protein [Blastopirellula sediminis]MCC9629478.1 NPCBM/NEW2 domain-containing protein [Blastopirellula sediminis]